MDREGGNPLGLLVGIFVAPLAATIIQMGISRTREFAADNGSAELTGNPRALARALQRLEAGAQQIPLEANPAFAPLTDCRKPLRSIPRQPVQNSSRHPVSHRELTEG